MTESPAATSLQVTSCVCCWLHAAAFPALSPAPPRQTPAPPPPLLLALPAASSPKVRGTGWSVRGVGGEHPHSVRAGSPALALPTARPSLARPGTDGALGVHIRPGRMLPAVWSSANLRTDSVKAHTHISPRAWGPTRGKSELRSLLWVAGGTCRVCEGLGRAGGAHREQKAPEDCAGLTVLACSLHKCFIHAWGSWPAQTAKEAPPAGARPDYRAKMHPPASRGRCVVGVGSAVLGLRGWLSSTTWPRLPRRRLRASGRRSTTSWNSASGCTTGSSPSKT